VKPHLAYLRYVLRHKWFVFVAGRKTRAPLWRLLIHDWSKFTPSEWRPYVAQFYNPDGSKRDVRRPDGGYDLAEQPYEFQRAWLGHQRRNKHHWQAWLLLGDNGQQIPIAMPERYVREMVADWMGAGRAITGKWEVATWYAKNRDLMVLHPETRDLVEDLLSSSVSGETGGKP
jgi:hypothetical protein